MKDKEIEVYINGEKVDITDIYEPLKQGEYFYKENDKWYVHKLKYVSKIIEEEPRDIEVCGSLFTRSEYNRLAGIKEDKKIEKLPMIDGTANILLATNQTRRKINEIIDVINKGDK